MIVNPNLLLLFSVGYLHPGSAEPDSSLSALYDVLVIINPNLPLLFSISSHLPGPTEPGASLSALYGALVIINPILPLLLSVGYSPLGLLCLMLASLLSMVLL